MEKLKSQLNIIIGIIYMCCFVMNADGQQTINGNIIHNGINRNYILHLPANHNVNTAIPLVYNLHGFGSNALEQEFYSGMNTVADTARFAVCYPNGVSTAWNVGWAFGSTADDVGFISALTDDLISKYGFDTKRIYSCGMSNGGFMSYVLACQLNNKIAAIASVTGSMVPGNVTSCNPGKPVPVLEIHGTADGTVAYNGSQIGVSIPDVMKFWQNNNECDLEPVKEFVPNISLTDNTTTEKYSYANCKNNKEVIHYKVIGGGHTWPGATIDIGTTSHDFNASSTIWNFFRKYSLDNTSVTNAPDPDVITEVYPNPFFDQFVVDQVTADTKLFIYNVQGSLVSQLCLVDGKNIINTTSWPKGIYFVRTEQLQKTNSFRLIKL
ncbi:MAG: T9SS type A sorting domain-containing protein [Saprospiraceae bacterium]|nr:T9SS type A sorting domain-containing protein [Saprospiraceae bacterium]